MIKTHKLTLCNGSLTYKYLLVRYSVLYNHLKVVSVSEFSSNHSLDKVKDSMLDYVVVCFV